MDFRFPRSLGTSSLTFGLLLFAFGASALAQDPIYEFELLYEIDGDSQGDLLGASVDGIGDIDGDGRGDLVVGIQRQDPDGQTNAGSAMVFSGADGAPIYTFDGPIPGATFGNEVRGAGDVNGDNVPDIIVGALFDAPNGINRAGSATVFSGADGSVLYLFEGDTIQGLLGRSIDGAGDVNLDGFADLIVGATDDDNGLDSGSVTIFSGLDGSVIYDIPGDASLDAFGASVAGLGDLNNDGHADFAVGSRGAGSIVAGGGRVHVFSGIDGSVMYVYNGTVAGGALHIVASAGDVDADGTPDFMAAAPDAEQVFVYSGADGSLIHLLTGNSVGDGFGSRIAGIGDANNDGVQDLLVGAPTDDRNGAGAGSATVYSGDDASVLFTFDGDAGDRIGSGVAALGDVNGDLCDDFVVGGFFDDNTATNSGSVKVFVFSGAACTPDETVPLVTITAPLDDTVFGVTSVMLDATIVDESSTVVTSTPAGISESLPAGGGSVSGLVALDVEGTNLLVVSAEDAAGNVGGTAVTVLRDTIDPAITLVSPGAGAILSISPATLTLQIDDATATDITFGENVDSLGRGGGVIMGDVDLVEGLNTITVSATDEAGNVGSLTFSLTLDLSAPLVTLDNPDDGACFGPDSTTVPVTVTVDDLTATTITSNVTGMATSLPAGGGVLTGTFDLGEGFNQIEITVTDSVGRVGSALNTVLLDTIGPDVQITSLDADIPVRATLDLNAIAQDVLPGTDVASVTFQVDGSTVSQVIIGPYETVFDSTTVADGFHAFSAIAADGKGNLGSDEVSVLVDNTVPTLTFDSVMDGDIVSGTLALELSLSDAGSGLTDVEVLVAGVAPTVDPSEEFVNPQGTAFVVGEQDTTILADGLLVLQATAHDAAGNEVVAQITVTVDNTAPENSVAYPPAGICVVGTITILVSGIDANLDHIELLIDGDLVATSTVSPLSFDYDTLQHLDGQLDITAIVYDSTDHVASNSLSVIVDNIYFRFTPTVLSLSGTLPDCFGVLKGTNLALVLPTENHVIELRVPGGNPVMVDPTWDGDDEIIAGTLPKLNMRFSRDELRASIAAGIAAGKIRATANRVALQCWVDGLKQGQLRLTLER
ncbi:MAG: hypothetical protein ACI8QZ_002957 [Chlamydiales bacterium]|jgi:hypothetical protein